MIQIDDDTLDRLAEKVADRIERGNRPETRDQWRALLTENPAEFRRLLDDGQVPADFLAVKKEADNG